MSPSDYATINLIITDIVYMIFEYNMRKVDIQ